MNKNGNEPRIWVPEPDLAMKPRALAALSPTRLSASRSFVNKLIEEKWQIRLDYIDINEKGEGEIRYTILAPEGVYTYLALLQEPMNEHRTGRIIGSSWDMFGALILGRATEEQIRATKAEIPDLYEGRAPQGTLVWGRANQSNRLYRHAWQCLAVGLQPEPRLLRKVGYLLRNTGLNGNGMFGTTSFHQIPRTDPLSRSYYAEMLAAYMMREVSVDAVEAQAKAVSPSTATKLSRESKSLIGVGNGSALGLINFVFNRPLLVNAHLEAYIEAVNAALSDNYTNSVPGLKKLEHLLERTIRYRHLDSTNYQLLKSSRQIAEELKRARVFVRAAIRGELVSVKDKTPLQSAHELISVEISADSFHIFNSLLMDLIPEKCEEISQSIAQLEEHITFDAERTVEELRSYIHRYYQWALSLPLNDEVQRDRTWYQARASEEPRSGPLTEAPYANELVVNYPTSIRTLEAELCTWDPQTPITSVLAERPELEFITTLVDGLKDKPYAIPRTDPHDIDFLPVWLIKLVCSFIHGIDRTKDNLGRGVLGVIFEGAPFRESLTIGRMAQNWWWTPPEFVEQANRKILKLHPQFGHGEKNSPTNNKHYQDKTAVNLAPTDASILAPTVEHYPIRVKYRELLQLAGRVYQALQVPFGSWQAAREFFVACLFHEDTAADYLGARIQNQVRSRNVQRSFWEKPELLSGTLGVMKVDNKHQSLVETGHVVTNILASVALLEPTYLTIVNTTNDGGLAGIVTLLRRQGIQLGIASESATSIRIWIQKKVTDSTQRQEAWADFIRFRSEGCFLKSQTFWNLYFGANLSLHPDTAISRQHAGRTLKNVFMPGGILTREFSPEDVYESGDQEEEDSFPIGPPR